MLMSWSRGQPLSGSQRGQLSGSPCLQLPPWQVSRPLQTVWSSHGVSSFLGTQPLCGSQVPSSQMPAQRIASNAHFPVSRSHRPPVWQALGVHVTGLPPAQRPSSQPSVCVQAFPSSHLVPGGAFGLLHVPVLGLQVPWTWHGSDGIGHDTGFEPVQTPPTQVEAPVQAFPSSHAFPLGTGCALQDPLAGSHTPTWHTGSLTRQDLGAPGAQVPAWQRSPTVHPLPSLQGVLLSGGFEQVPSVGLQVPAEWH